MVKVIMFAPAIDMWAKRYDGWIRWRRGVDQVVARCRSGGGEVWIR